MTYTSNLFFQEPIDPEAVMGLARDYVGVLPEQPLKVSLPDYYPGCTMIHSTPGGYPAAIYLYIAPPGGYRCDCEERGWRCECEAQGWAACLSLDTGGDWTWGIQNHRRLMAEIAAAVGVPTQYSSDFDALEEWP